MTTFPTIHINGTSKKDLLDGYRKAIDAVQDAVVALGSVEFNARDYYVQGSHAWVQASDERVEQFQKLYAVKDHLMEIALHISKEGRD
jgi:hypothetical protein